MSTPTPVIAAHLGDQTIIIIIIIIKDVGCRWKDNLRDDYTSAFNIDNIQRINSILTETLTKMASTTQNISDDLYVNFKDIFITPGISTNMYKEIEKKKKTDLSKKNRQHGRKTWFSDEYEFYAMNVWL